MLTNPQAVGLSTRVTTSFQTITVVRTTTSPTQTLFTTECAQLPSYPTPTPTPTPTSTPTSTSPIYVPPLTITSTSTSTDPNGNLVLVTVAIVSTPPPISTQYGAGSGGPNTTALIGGVVGGVVGVLILIGILWYFIYRKLRGRRDETWEEDEGLYTEAAKYK